MDDELRCRWYARHNDLIGGWCVMPADEAPSSGTPEVADLLSQAVAEHIVWLHNEWLGRACGDGRPGHGQAYRK
jgi:hypothetical protein